MSLLFAHELSLAYGPRILLDEESLVIHANDRVGLVGPNGAGKSTLMKLLAGAARPDSGEVLLSRGARCGYLSQELTGLPDAPVVDAVLAQVPGRTRLEEELGSLETALSGAGDEAEQLDLAQRLADHRDTLEHFDARFGRHRAERLLGGLGFGAQQLAKYTGELSGGWRMRAALAGLLLSDPDLLLLDEPTNHLDVPTLAWFDDFLRRSRRALVLISHDREFLNRQISRVLSFEPEGLRSYSGNYDDYRRQRTAEAGQLEARAARQAARRAEIEAFIGRFGAKATKARQVKSKEKQLAREKEIVTLESRRTVAFRFPEVERAGRDVVRLAGAGKRYGEHVLYDGLALQVLRGDRIAIVGPNGAGKTTLLKLVAKELVPDAGTVVHGHNVSAGYYAQHHTERLDPARTVLEEVATLVPDKPQSWVRGVLGSFLFSGDDVDKRISALSGGERARVALARLLVLPSNLLLMDEPTNHLDLDSSEALIEALEAYGGTLVFVSHNRGFVNRLATKVWEVEDGAVHELPGNLDDYLHHKSLVAAAQSSAGGAAETPSPAVRTGAGEKERKRAEAQARQARSVREKPIREELALVESRVAELEQTLRAAESALADSALYADFERARPHLDASRDAREALDVLYEKWESLQLLLEGSGEP